jgi:3-oxoacyl-[acyl-carrier-protein] synthase III
MSIYSKIIGTGSCLPPNRVTNDDLTRILGEKGLETSDEWIVSRSGILRVTMLHQVWWQVILQLKQLRMH